MKLPLKCDHCGKQYSLKNRSDNHKCEPIKRKQYIKTPSGQLAWICYKKWRQYDHKPYGNINTFINSRLFNAFSKFSTFVIQSNVPDIDIFIKLMVNKKINPFIWLYEETYKIFIEYFDNIDYQKHCIITINTMFNIAKKQQCDVSSIFNSSIDSQYIIQLIIQRKLSPWILLNSNKFKYFVQHYCDITQQNTIKSIFNNKNWNNIFKNNSKKIMYIKQYINELNI